MSYLGDLMMRLAGGAMKLPDDFRRRHADFLRAAQADDGGFAGRRGSGDLYYTGFALRGLALLGMLDEPVAGRAAGFLQARLDPEKGDRSNLCEAPSGPLRGQLDLSPFSGREASQPALPIVDFLSLVYSAVLLEMIAEIDVFAAAGLDRRQAVVAAVAPYRCPDGGYAKTPGGRHSSTYHTFLVALCRELAGVPPDDREPIVQLVRSRRRADGGFVELAPLKQSGTNPTAAAVSLLLLLDALDETTADGAAEFLAGMQNAEGGFRANTVIPVADLLSTFTALVTLGDLGGLDEGVGSLSRPTPSGLPENRGPKKTPDPLAVRAYAQSLENPGGGFRGGAWDDAADVEYTFYGVGTLALLAARE